ncbi:AAA family ATPase [Segatella copri]|uniref:AAA family ATPase n=1 Tax=Segatella copri TaxID=165179 RepID=UPI003F8B3AA5
MDIPFIYGRLAEKESFIDRIEDRRELKNFLRHGINVILVSPRRWGKSSLVRTSMEELMQEESKTKVCFMDASKIHTEEEFYNKFASIVIQGVSSTLEQKLSDLVKFINRFTPSITIASDPMNSVEVNLKVNPVKESPENILQLPERIAEAKGIKIIVCIDEFQQLANLPKWKNLEAMLRAEWQLQHHTTYCLYGSKMHMMKDIFNKANSPFFKFGQLMNLKRIAKEYWIPYIMSNFKKTGKNISESQAECLCERVKYNSWYVQQYCFFLWSHTDKEVTQELLDNQLQLVLDTNEDLFLTEMDELTPTQIGMLKAIASGEKHFNAKDVVETYGLGQPQSITRNKKVLVEKDLVEKHLQDFSFVDPVFELWLKREYNILP